MQQILAHARTLSGGVSPIRPRIRNLNSPVDEFLPVFLRPTVMTEEASILLSGYDIKWPKFGAVLF